MNLETALFGALKEDVDVAFACLGIPTLYSLTGHYGPWNPQYTGNYKTQDLAMEVPHPALKVP